CHVNGSSPALAYTMTNPHPIKENRNISVRGIWRAMYRNRGIEHYAFFEPHGDAVACRMIFAVFIRPKRKIGRGSSAKTTLGKLNVRVVRWLRQSLFGVYISDEINLLQFRNDESSDLIVRSRTLTGNLFNLVQEHINLRDCDPASSRI